MQEHSDEWASEVVCSSSTYYQPTVSICAAKGAFMQSVVQSQAQEIETDTFSDKIVGGALCVVRLKRTRVGPNSWWCLVCGVGL